MIIHIIKSMFPTFYGFAQNIITYSWRGNREGVPKKDRLVMSKYIPWLIVSLLLLSLLVTVLTVFRYEYIGSGIGWVYKIDRITGRVYIIQYDTISEVKEPTRRE